MSRDGVQRRRPARCGEAGGAVLELLVAAALAVAVLGGAIALLRTHAVLARQLQDELGAVSSATWALDVGGRDLQLAGADPRRSGVVALRAADAVAVELDADLDGDGAIDPASAERLALLWSAGSGGRMLRRLGTQSMAIASPIGAGGFRLRYFDAVGDELGAAGGALDADQRARVHRVRLEVAVRASPSRPGEEVRLFSEAALRARLPGSEPQ